MAIGTVEEFLSVLERGKLLKPEEFTDAQDLAEGVSDPTTLAKTLVRQGLLSRWQAGQLLAGRSTFFLGKYKLIELLGKGGMGSVFLGEHVMMNRLVALKIIPRHVSKDPAGLERFLVEARTIAAVDHPNIVQAYNVDNDGDLYYLVMEYVEGLDLQRLVEAEGPLDCPDAVDCVRQAADGLAHAHARKMVHCDIKPSNLIVNPQGVVKILDMGMARLVGPERLGMDASEQDERIIGSVDYQAPEQALRTVDFDHRADIYSLGCTLYFLLSGHAPFAQGTLAERILKHQTMPPPDLSAERDNVPQSLSDICRKMMAKRPVDRYQSAADVSGMLNDWRPGEQRVQRILSAKKTQLVDELPGPELLGADLSALLRQSMSSSSTSSRRTHVTYERKIWGLPATTLRILLTAGILSLFLILVGIAIFWPFGQSDKSVAIKNIDRTQTKTNTKNTAKVLGSDTEKKTTPFPAADVASKASQPPAAPDLDNLSIPSVPVSINSQPKVIAPKDKPKPAAKAQKQTQPVAPEVQSPPEDAEKAQADRQPKLDAKEIFKDLPKAIDLPAIPRSLHRANSSEATTNLGVLNLPPEIAPVLDLIGGETALKDDEESLVLQSDVKQPLVWNIYKTTAAKQIEIARLAFENQKLTFRWMPKAGQEHGDSLRKCGILVSVQEQKRFVQLCLPKPARPLYVDLYKGTAKVNIQGEVLAETPNLRVQFLPHTDDFPTKVAMVPGGLFKITPANKCVSYLTFFPETKYSNFKVKVSFELKGQRIIFETAAYYQLPGDEEPKEFRAKEVLSRYQKNALRLQNDTNELPRLSENNPRREAFATRIEREKKLDEAFQTLGSLSNNLLKQGTLHYRVYIGYDKNKYKVILFDTLMKQ